VKRGPLSDECVYPCPSARNECVTCGSQFQVSRHGRTGLDKRLRDEVLKTPGCSEFVAECLGQMTELIELAMQQAPSERPAKLVFGFGCAAGKHRSVSICVEVCLLLKATGMHAAPAER